MQKNTGKSGTQPVGKSNSSIKGVMPKSGAVEQKAILAHTSFKGQIDNPKGNNIQKEKTMPKGKSAQGKPVMQPHSSTKKHL